MNGDFGTPPPLPPGTPTADAFRLPTLRVGGLLLPSRALTLADPVTLFQPVTVPVTGDRVHVYADAAKMVAVVPDKQPLAWRKAGVYGVDSGTAAMWDPARTTKLKAMGRNTINFMFQARDIAEAQGLPAIVVGLPDNGGGIAVVESTGGDGAFPVWQGIDAAGNTVAVLTRWR